jgi:hypothetical protein
MSGNYMRKKRISQFFSFLHFSTQLYKLMGKVSNDREKGKEGKKKMLKHADDTVMC